MQYPVTKAAGLTGEMVENYFFHYCVARTNACDQTVIEMLNAGISSVLSQATGDRDTGVITYVEYMGYMAIANSSTYLHIYIRNRCRTCGKYANQCKHMELNPRVTWDYNVSMEYPIFKGTWITTKIVANMMLDGKPDSDILAMFPELTIDDINVLR